MSKMLSAGEPPLLLMCGGRRGGRHHASWNGTRVARYDVKATAALRAARAVLLPASPQSVSAGLAVFASAPAAASMHCAKATTPPATMEQECDRVTEERSKREAAASAAATAHLWRTEEMLERRGSNFEGVHQDWR